MYDNINKDIFTKIIGSYWKKPKYKEITSLHASKNIITDADFI